MFSGTILPTDVEHDQFYWQREAAFLKACQKAKVEGQYDIAVYFAEWARKLVSSISIKSPLQQRKLAQLTHLCACMHRLISNNEFALDMFVEASRIRMALENKSVEDYKQILQCYEKAIDLEKDVVRLTQLALSSCEITLYLNPKDEVLKSIFMVRVVQYYIQVEGTDDVEMALHYLQKASNLSFVSPSDEDLSRKINVLSFLFKENAKTNLKLGCQSSASIALYQEIIEHCSRMIDVYPDISIPLKNEVIHYLLNNYKPFSPFFAFYYEVESFFSHDRIFYYDQLLTSISNLLAAVNLHLFPLVEFKACQTTILYMLYVDKQKVTPLLHSILHPEVKAARELLLERVVKLYELAESKHKHYTALAASTLPFNIFQPKPTPHSATKLAPNNHTPKR